MISPDARSRLMADAINVLSANDTGRFIKPGPRQYPGQWNWDAAFSVIGLAHVDPTRARDEIRALLAGQWADGMVPHIVFHDPDVDYFPGPEVWGTTEASPALPTSGITQPPLLATALQRLHRIAPDRHFLDEVLDPIERWHRWFHRERVRDGLVRILHPWESGMDNSPRFDRGLSVIPPSPLPVARRDRIHVAPDQRPSDADYQAYLSILAGLKAARYRPEPGSALFDVGDVFVTAVLCRAESDLAELFTATGRTADHVLARRDTLRRGLEAVWSQDHHLFLDDGGDPVPTTGGLLPVWAHPAHPSAAYLPAAVADPTTFGPSPDASWYPTSVAKNTSEFDRRRYWRGPVWININWLVVHALEESGHRHAAEAVRAATVELVDTSGFWEYYDPTNGEGLGSDRFSWTAAVILDFLADS